MALVVEDGSGKSNAQSFASVADADAYAAARGYSDWTGDATAKETALTKAADFLCRYYSFIGTKKTKAQALAWPRADATDIDGFTHDSEVPVEVKNANIELARRALTADLMPDLARGGKVRSVGVGDLSVTFADDAPVNKVYQTVDLLLRPLLMPSDPIFRIDLAAPTEPDYQFSPTLHDDEAIGGGEVL
jgi:hypothetical protein